MMTAFDAPNWNLAQAAAWVVYREKHLVEQLKVAAEGAFGAIGRYSATWPSELRRHARLSDLHDALSEGRLISEGYHQAQLDKLAPIPAVDWDLLDLHPPFAYNRRYPGRRLEPWKEIKVRSADVKRLWRHSMEVSGRTKFDWPAIRVLYEQARQTNPKFSRNKLIEEVQLAYQQKYSKEPPSRSAIQRHLPEWK